MFSTAFSLGAIVTLIVEAVAQSATMTSTASITTSSPSIAMTPTEIAVPIGSSSTGLAASIVSADPCKTTVVLECTETGSMPCGHPMPVTFTIVEGQATYDYHFDLTSDDFSVIMTETCKFHGPIASVTQAECSSSMSSSMSGSTTTFTTTGTFTSMLFATVPITAAADKLPPASALCSAATTGSSSQMASPTSTTTTTGGSSHSKEAGAGMLVLALVGAAIGYLL